MPKAYQALAAIVLSSRNIFLVETYRDARRVFRVFRNLKLDSRNSFLETLFTKLQTQTRASKLDSGKHQGSRIAFNRVETLNLHLTGTVNRNSEHHQSAV